MVQLAVDTAGDHIERTADICQVLGCVIRHLLFREDAAGDLIGQLCERIQAHKKIGQAVLRFFRRGTGLGTVFRAGPHTDQQPG